MNSVKVNGTSMSPLFKNGDIVLYNKVNKKDIGRGDCIIYNYKGSKLLHRVIDKFGDCFILSNDDDMDEHIISFEDIIGKVYTNNLLKKGFSGFIYHKLFKIIRKCTRKLN